MVADGKVYVGDEDGDLVVFAATKEKKIISETMFDSPIYSTPIIANGVLYVGTQTHLYALQDASKILKKDAPAGVETELKKP
jgi:outer membrane protein assembly factor BamB